MWSGVMAINSGAFLLCITPKSLTIYCSLLTVLALVNSKAAGRPDCTPSCGDLKDIRSPFRLQRDPPECGPVQLDCSDDGKPTIYLWERRYFVTNISHDYLWVVDADLEYRSCPLPPSNRLPLRSQEFYLSDSTLRLMADSTSWACFVNCSRPVIKNGKYRPVNCLSDENSSSFVYVMTSYTVGDLEPYCGYLGLSPLGDKNTGAPGNGSYADIVKFMRNGFAVVLLEWNGSTCRRESSTSWRNQMNSESFLDKISTIYSTEPGLLRCQITYPHGPDNFVRNSMSPLLGHILFWVAEAMEIVLTPIVLCRFVFAPLAVFTFIVYKFWKTRISVDAVEKFLRMQQAVGPRRYAYTDITAITNHFREKLGHGGFGSVYKGVLPGDVHVAVKMLGNSTCKGEDFISEVSTIGRIHHINVVHLVGFCSEELRRALVYEYMPRGSLDRYIFSSERSFSWDKLNEIALGIARGIDYLHRGCDMQILHFDIKPHNILLDNNLVPKIADFGLAKLYPKDYSLVSVSAARGTIGYIAPEQISRSFGVISCKSDVYSFGMLLLEMAGGRRNVDPNAQNSSQAYYPSWVYNQLSRQEECEITEAIHLHEMEKKLCMVGLWCIQMKSDERPTTSEVIGMLEGGVDDLQMPPKPFFCGDEHISLMDSCQFSSELTIITEEVE